jgi:lipopolysaccharide/colanic/teichoic acid biosynthesis glycosyltransferase
MKRAFDFFVSVSLLVVLAVPLALLAIGILLVVGKPIFFRQVRPGRNGNPFNLVKFRTMSNALDYAGVPLPDAERLVPFGYWLRSTSLDELPTLWNVLRGDMSLVGPRPLLMQYLPLYSARQARRHEVRPGITGWAQVNGRNALTWPQKFELDVWYVENRSFWLDLRILWMTLVVVLRRDGISAQGEATMPPFTGSNPDGTPKV